MDQSNDKLSMGKKLWGIALVIIILWAAISWIVSLSDHSGTKQCRNTSRVQTTQVKDQDGAVIDTKTDTIYGSECDDGIFYPRPEE